MKIGVSGQSPPPARQVRDRLGLGLGLFTGGNYPGGIVTEPKIGVKGDKFVLI